MKIMSLINKGAKYIFNRNYRFIVNSNLGMYNDMDDEIYIVRKYEAITGLKLNLNGPVTYNEKLQWLKLNDHNPEYIKMVDKVAVKDYVASIIGEEYIIPTLGVWTSPEDIDFESLPNQFVLKCNHNSGLGMYICDDKSKMNIKKVKRELSKGLKQDYYLTAREWPYKDVSRKIIAEKFLVDESGTELKDYKVFCFGGIPKFVQVDINRFVNHKRNLYTTDWELMNATSYYPQEFNLNIQKPLCLDKMLEFASKLSKGIPHVRVDFYSIGEQIYFGELTFFNSSGYKSFEPPEWNKIIGDWLILPTKTK